MFIDLVSRHSHYNGIMPDTVNLYDLHTRRRSNRTFRYSRQSLDPFIPGDIHIPPFDWMNNGSFLVFRRLKQHVKQFWHIMKEKAKLLKHKHEGFHYGPVDLASRIVGRWPSGAPISRTPNQDLTQLGNNDLFNNYFHYASDTMRIKTDPPDPFPQAKADPIGITCPLFSHIRKVNTRYLSNDVGGSFASFQNRIIRRGIPYGIPLLTDAITNNTIALKNETKELDRGLLFVGFCISIEEQFEFLQNRWMSNPVAPRDPGGHDIFIGLNGNTDEHAQRVGRLWNDNYQTANISTNAEWVIPTGGGYYFTPSISAIRDVLAKQT